MKIITATSVDVEWTFSQRRLVLSHVRSCLSVQSTRALLCLAGWSNMRLVKDEDIKSAVVLPEVNREEEELALNWDAVYVGPICITSGILLQLDPLLPNYPSTGIVTPGFADNSYPHTWITRTCVMGTGLLGYGYRLPWKTPGLPVLIPSCSDFLEQPQEMNAPGLHFITIVI